MNHEVFGEIVFHREDGWFGQCRLPAFAEYGRQANGALDESDEQFRQGIFSLFIHDSDGNGPAPEQVNAFRFLLENEQAVCRAVMSGMLDCYRYHYGGIWNWFRRPQSRFSRWLARWLKPPEYTRPEDLIPVVRCTGVEVGADATAGYAWLAFGFHTSDYLEVEHGLSVIFHPEKGARWGDGSAIVELTVG